MILPDLEKNDGMLQVAVYQPDRENFGAWYQRHILSRMTGGEKDIQELRNLTSGKTTIVSFPLEEEEEAIKEDFTSMGINYSQLPDLLNFNEMPQPSLRELEKMVKEIQVAEVNEEEEEKETDQQPDMLQDREQWDLSGDIIDCFRRYSSELSPEEQEEIIKGVEEGLTDQDVKRYFTLVGAEKMRQYRRVLIARKKKE